MADRPPPPAPSAATPSPLLTPALRAVLGVLGGASFGTGILAVFVTQNGTGTGVLLAFGGLLLVFALLGNRIESFEVGGASLRLRAAAADRYALADASEHAGDPHAAAELREEARSLMRAAGPLAAEYGRIRRSMRSGAARTEAMEDVVGQIKWLATGAPFPPGEVREWLRSGSDGERIVALAIMQARSDLRDFGDTLDTVAQPRSPFEQFHALTLVSKMLDDLGEAELRRLIEVVETGLARRASVLHGGADRVRLADEILRRAQERVRGLSESSPGASGAAPHPGSPTEGSR